MSIVSLAIEAVKTAFTAGNDAVVICQVTRLSNVRDTNSNQVTTTSTTFAIDGILDFSDEGDIPGTIVERLKEIVWVKVSDNQVVKLNDSISLNSETYKVLDLSSVRIGSAILLQKLFLGE